MYIRIIYIDIMYIDIMYICICIYIFTQLTELTKFMKKLSDQT